MRGIRPRTIRRSAGAVLMFALLWVSAAPGWAQSAASEDALVASRVQALLDLVAISDARSDAAIQALEALQADDQLSQAARERVLHDLAMALRAEPESAAGRRALAWLADYQSQIFLQYEGRGPATIPAWRVAGVARGTLALWDRAAAVALVQGRLATGRLNLAAELTRAENAQDASALTEALTSAPSDQLIAHRDDLLAMLERNGAQAPAVAAAALRLQDAELCQAVFAASDRRTATRLIAAIGRTLPPEQAFPILKRASLEPDLASAALVEIGRSAGELPAAQDFLLDSLADPQHGGSAAAALAALAGDEMVADVAAELAASGDATFQSKAVLMLALDGSPLARESLQGFARREDVSEALRQEVSAWLGEAPQ